MEGRCSICGYVSKLTWDHIPPQSCGNKGNVKISDLFPVDQEKISKGKFSQNGTKYKTVCGSCNNKLMGTGYDKILTEFYHLLINFLKESKEYRGIKYITSNINNLIKAVFCKFLAMDKVFLKDIPTEQMRKYIFEDFLEDELHLYFRFYPFDGYVNVRNIAPVKVDKAGYPATSGILISLVYFFPMAFVLSNKIEKNCGINLTDIVRQGGNEITLLQDTIFFEGTKELIPLTWPAIIDDNTVILTNDDYTNNFSTKIKK